MPRKTTVATSVQLHLLMSNSTNNVFRYRLLKDENLGLFKKALYHGSNKAALKYCALLGFLSKGVLSNLRVRRKNRSVFHFHSLLIVEYFGSTHVLWKIGKNLYRFTLYSLRRTCSLEFFPSIPLRPSPSLLQLGGVSRCEPILGWWARPI